MIIIGITGTNGAGKGTVVDFLIQERGFVHYSVRDYLLKIIEERGLPENRDSMISVANELRKNHSSSYIVDQLYDKAKKNKENCIIESIRTPGEIASLRKKGDFILLSIDANPEIRYQRVKIRNSETDHISFNVFLENERKEMTSANPDKQNIAACIKEADYSITNNGSIQGLQLQLEELFRNKIIKIED